MLQKVIIKRKTLTPKQRFELLFREPTPEEKEMLEMAIANEKRKINVWSNPKNKKKYVYKIKPIYAIKEELGNNYHIMYYKYSGHAMLYHENKLVTILNETNIFIINETELKFLPWLLDKNNYKIIYDNTKYNSYYKQIWTEIFKNRIIKGENRKRFSIIYK